MLIAMQEALLKRPSFDVFQINVLFVLFSHCQSVSLFWISFLFSRFDGSLVSFCPLLTTLKDSMSTFLLFLQLFCKFAVLRLLLFSLYLFSAYPLPQFCS